MVKEYIENLRNFIKYARPIDWFGIGITTGIFVAGGYIMGTYSILKGLPLVIGAILIPIVAYKVVRRKANP